MIVVSKELNDNAPLLKISLLDWLDSKNCFTTNATAPTPKTDRTLRIDKRFDGAGVELLFNVTVMVELSENMGVLVVLLVGYDDTIRMLIMQIGGGRNARSLLSPFIGSFFEVWYVLYDNNISQVG